MATYFSANCVYIVFIASSVHDVVNFGLNIQWDVRTYIALIILPVLLIGQVSISLSSYITYVVIYCIKYILYNFHFNII